MTSRRRRTRKRVIDNDICSSCPICYMSFPSSQYCGALEHEEIVLAHITRCSASSSAAVTLVNNEVNDPEKINDNNSKTIAVDKKAPLDQSSSRDASPRKPKATTTSAATKTSAELNPPLQNDINRRISTVDKKARVDQSSSWDSQRKPKATTIAAAKAVATPPTKVATATQSPPPCIARIIDSKLHSQKSDDKTSNAIREQPNTTEGSLTYSQRGKQCVSSSADSENLARKKSKVPLNLDKKRENKIRPNPHYDDHETTSTRHQHHHNRHLQRKNSDSAFALNCPICDKEFSLMRYSNLKGLERAMITHVEKCSASSSTTTTAPDKTIPPESATKASNPKHVDSPSKCSRPDTICASTAEEKKNSIIYEKLNTKETASTLHGSKLKNATLDTTGRLTNDSQVLGNGSVCINNNKKNYASKAAKGVGPNSEFVYGHSSRKTLHCPICGKGFPSRCNTNPKALERAMIKHVEKCSALSATATPQKAAGCNTDSMDVSTPDLVDSPQKLSRGAICETVDANKRKLITENSVENSIVSASSLQSAKSEKVASPDILIAPKIDPGHLLAQTWWRKEKGHERKKRKRTSSLLTKFKAPFDIASCVVADAEDTNIATENPTRERKSKVQLKLNCPYCRKVFSPTWIAMTENSMIKHIARCKTKYPPKPTPKADQLQSPNNSLSSSMSMERRISLDCISNESTLSDLSGSSRRSSRNWNGDHNIRPVYVSARRSASHNATMRAERAKSIQCLLHGAPKEALGDIIMCDMTEGQKPTNDTKIEYGEDF